MFSGIFFFFLEV